MFNYKACTYHLLIDSLTFIHLHSPSPCSCLLQLRFVLSEWGQNGRQSRGYMPVHLAPGTVDSELLIQPSISWPLSNMPVHGRSPILMILAFYMRDL
jgi:hypothetical protein